MIVKNEAKTIVPFLESVRDHIDYAVICDTGSDDNTIKVIRDFCKKHDIEVEVYQHTWRNFAHNRNLALNCARGHCDYILIADSDWKAVIEPGSLDNLDQSWYSFPVTDGNTVWYTERLIKDIDGWSWRYPVREILQSETEEHPYKLPGLVMHQQSVGGLLTERYERDIVLLESAVETGEDLGHHLFYLANTHAILKNHAEARKAYNQLLDIAVETELDKEKHYFALWQLAVLEIDTKKKALRYVQAHAYRPTRLEAAYELIRLLRKQNNVADAHRLAEKLVQDNLPVPNDVVFVAPWIYEWAILREYAITSAQMGYFHDARRSFSQLLTHKTINQKARRTALANLQNIDRAIRETHA